jgi:pyruvate carboxylase
VSNKHIAGTIEKQPKVDEANSNQVPAPMSGMIASAAVMQDKHVEAENLLVTIEAMKMETAIRSEQSGIIAWVVAGAGTQVDAKYLILEFAGEQGACKLVLQDKNRYKCEE